MSFDPSSSSRRVAQIASTFAPAAQLLANATGAFDAIPIGAVASSGGRGERMVRAMHQPSDTVFSLCVLSVPAAPPDEIFNTGVRFRADTDPRKVNLGVGRKHTNTEAQTMQRESRCSLLTYL